MDRVNGARGEALPAAQPEKVVLAQIELIQYDSCTAGRPMLGEFAGSYDG